MSHVVQRTAGRSVPAQLCAVQNQVSRRTLQQAPTITKITAPHIASAHPPSNKMSIISPSEYFLV